MDSLCEVYGIKKKFISPYHPSSNGLCERTNRKIIRAIKHYVLHDAPDDWDRWLPELMDALNSAYNESVGDSAHFAIFAFDKRTGREVPSSVKIFIATFINV